VDFSIAPDLKKLLATIREFVDVELIPLEAKLGEGFSALGPALEAKRRLVKDAGLWTPHLPKEHGGMGLSLAEFGHVSEELGRSPLGHYAFNCQAPDIGNTEILLDYGTEAQKKRWLEPLIAGEHRSCFSMTEPEFAGSNPVLMGTMAEHDEAAGQWVINGHKWFTTSADGAAFAVVMAVTDPDGNPHARASQIIVPTDTPGFRLMRNIPMMGHAGSGWASHGEIAYEDCRVPFDSLLGPRGAGFLIAQQRLGPGRIHHCMRWIGICERAFDMMCQHAATRELAPGKPLGSRQTVQAWIAESRAEIHAARLIVLHAAWRIDHEGVYAAREEISLIKFHVASVLQRVLDRAIQVHGALGLTDDTPLAFWYGHERGARIYDGPDEVHKTVVARRILKKYGISVQ